MLLDNFDLYKSQKKPRVNWDLGMNKCGYAVFSKKCAKKIDFKRYTYLSFFINKNNFSEIGIRFYEQKQGNKILAGISPKSRANDLLKDYPNLLGKFYLKKHQYSENCLDCVFEKEAENGK